MSQPPIIDTPENWDKASKGYSENVAPVMMVPFAHEMIDRLGVDATTEALEVAAGSGALTMSLAPKVKSLLSTDFSPSMLSLLEEKVLAAGLTNVRLEQMDGMALDLDDDRFDRAGCSFGLMLFPDRHKGFSELRRVLKPGGKAVVSAWTGPEKFEALGIFMESIQLAFPDLPKPESPPPVMSLGDVNIFKKEMEEAGFINVQVDYVVKTAELRGFDEMWAMLTAGAPPVQMMFNQVGEAGKDKIKSSLQQLIRDRFGNRPILISNTATIGVGSVD